MSLAVEVRADIPECLAGAEGYVLALLDSKLVTEEENIRLGVELAERSPVLSWEL